LAENSFIFQDFLLEVDPHYQWFALQIQDLMQQNGCKLKMMLAKNGYVVSYSHGKKNRVIMNFVFRKNGLVTRIYGDHVVEYLDFLDSLPDNMRQTIEKAPNCKRFESPPRCSPRCVGYVFSIKGAQYQKCRYSCFFFEVNDDSIPYIKTFLEKELLSRNAST